MSTIYDKLADLRIQRVKRRPGQQSDLRCPQCNEKERESLSLKVDDDEQGATYQCHRCGWRGNVSADQDRQPRARYAGPFSKSYEPEPKRAPPALVDLSGDPNARPDWFWDVFAERHIGARTVEHFRCWGAEAKYFRRLKKETRAIAWPYYHQGKLVTIKYRSIEDKDFTQEVSGPSTLFNADSLIGAKRAVWFEGEFDAMLAWEALQDPDTAVVSLKDGAKSFAALDTHKDEIVKIEQHILAGDNDREGMASREELARRIGRHLVRMVRWPDGCKDACDAGRAVAKGVVDDSVRDMINRAQPYPIEGVFVPFVGMLAEFDKLPQPATMSTGCTVSDDIVRLPGDGRLILVTGYANDGKSAWMRHIAVHTAHKHKRNWLMFLGEDRTVAVMQKFAAIFHDRFYRNLGDIDKRQADEFLLDHIRVIHGVPRHVSITVDWLMQTAAQCVLQYGTTDVLIDPWNEIEHQRGNRTETDYIGDVLKQKCRDFIEHYGCNLWIIAHPAKPPPDRRRVTDLSPPTGYDMAGSANWANKCDLGLTIFYNKDKQTELHVWKARERQLWGDVRRHCTLDFDQATGRFRDPIVINEPPPGPPPRNYTERDDEPASIF